MKTRSGGILALRIVVVGAGEVGYAVAKNLSEDRHDIILIEEDESRADKVENELDVMLIRGNGARPPVLERAGIGPDGTEVDMLIACTNRDEVNILACWIARKMGVKQVISRAVGLEYTDTKAWAHDLGINLMISPERSVARRIESLLEIRTALEATEIAGGRAGMYLFEIAPGARAAGVALRDLRRMFPQITVLLIYVQHGDEGFIPKADNVLREGDLVYALCYREQIHLVEELFNPQIEHRLKRVFIIGGGKVGYQVALQLQQRVRGVKTLLFEQDRAKAERLAAELRDTTIIWGDGADEDLLIQEGIENTDGIVATTGEDEVNLMLATQGKILGADKSIAVVKRHNYLKLAGKIPVDVILNRNQTLSEVIIRNVRYPGSSRLLKFVEQIGAEIMEVKLTQKSNSVGYNLLDLPLPPGVILGLVTRGHDVFIPSAGTTLQPHDSLAIFAAEERMPEALEILLGEREEKEP